MAQQRHKQIKTGIPEKSDLDQQGDKQINIELKLKLYQKGKQRMIVQELKKPMNKAQKDRHNEWENQVHMG